MADPEWAVVVFAFRPGVGGQEFAQAGAGLPGQPELPFHAAGAGRAHQQGTGGVVGFGVIVQGARVQQFTQVPSGLEDLGRGGAVGQVQQD
ncbi:hypothetical protein, partial [Acrocarpospora macrocephala]|uniref:hypothetical protein n=1 Tax=Acrocarpospora macrocephala TaxID=150177 RepID=UPI0031D66600